MINVDVWMEQFLEVLKRTFADRLWFVGLQGSYRRGEATEESDLDVVVVLDTLNAADVRAYRALLDTLPHRDLLCGFLAGKAELLSWDIADLFQFYHDTKPVLGSLDALLPLLGREAAARALKISACNVYHGCVHNMVHEQDGAILKGLYKCAAFAVRASIFGRTGTYASRHRELLALSEGMDHRVIEILGDLKNGRTVEFEQMSEILLEWSKQKIESV